MKGNSSTIGNQSPTTLLHPASLLLTHRYEDDHSRVLSNVRSISNHEDTNPTSKSCAIFCKRFSQNIVCSKVIASWISSRTYHRILSNFVVFLCQAPVSLNSWLLCPRIWRTMPNHNCSHLSLSHPQHYLYLFSWFFLIPFCNLHPTCLTKTHVSAGSWGPSSGRPWIQCRSQGEGQGKNWQL